MDLRRLKEFIDLHWDGRSSLLLGYSGGPDSKALLYALLEIGFRSLHVAHVDHGWREESAAQAERLRSEVLSLQLPFHSVRLEGAKKSNREEGAREERLTYFQHLRETHSCQALLLGHQAGDQIETVLKRIFEGAHLPYLGGMEPVSSIGGLPIWRPFLKTPRNDLLAFLKKRDLTPLWDPTNEDPAYLRSRLRTDLIPLLNRSFGKAVGGNIEMLGQRAVELKHYLNRKTADHPILEGPWGTASYLSLLERLEQRHLLQKIFDCEGVHGCSRSLLEALLDWIFSNKADLATRIGSRDLIVDRGWIFVLRKRLPQFNSAVLLQEGRFQSGAWTIEGEVVDKASPGPPLDWAAIWRGELAFSLPLASLQQALFLQIAKTKSLFPKAPAFLRRYLPALQLENGENYNLFDGKALPEKGRVFKLTLRVGSSP